jgi:mRNA interferase MazF
VREKESDNSMGALMAYPIRDIPSEVYLGKEDGVAKDCAINFDHIQTVSKARIGTLVTKLSRDKLLQVRDAIRFALDL